MNGTVYKIYIKVYDGEQDKIHIYLTYFPKEKDYYIIINAITNEDSNEISYYNITKNPMVISLNIIWTILNGYIISRIYILILIKNIIKIKLMNLYKMKRKT